MELLQSIYNYVLLKNTVSNVQHTLTLGDVLLITICLIAIKICTWILERFFFKVHQENTKRNKRKKLLFQLFRYSIIVVGIIIAIAVSGLHYFFDVNIFETS